MQDTKSNPPTCDKCHQPMQLIDVLEAKKGDSNIKVRIFTCFKDGMFKNVEERKDG